MEAWWLVNVAVDKRHKIRRKEKIMVFPWDKGTDKKPQTKSQMISVMKSIARSTANNKKKKKYPVASNILNKRVNQKNRKDVN